MGQSKPIRKWAVKHWVKVATGLFLIGVCVVLYGVALGSHAGGILPEEQAYISSVDTISGAMNTPGFLPHRIATYATLRIGAEHIIWYRLISVISASLAVLCFYYVIHRWYTKRVALIGTVLFASSSMTLHFARLAAPDILLFSVIGLMAVGLWLQITKRRKRALIVFLTALASTLYIPGLIWVALGVLIWQGKRLVKVLHRQTIWFRLGCIATVALVITPAVVSLSAHPREILTVAGLPTQLAGMRDYLEHAVNVVSGIGWAYDASPSLWVNRTPLLDVVSIAMLVLGLYSLRFEKKLLRSKLQVGLLVLGIVLTLTMGPVSLLAVIPILYLIVTGGFAFMLQQWFAVFPRNPFARGVAVLLISVSIIGVSIYHVYRYAVAWPGHPETKAVITDQYLIN